MKYPNGYTCELFVTTESNGEFFHIWAKVVDSAESRKDGSWISRPEGLLDLIVSSQGTNARGDRHLYAFELRYQQVYALDLHKLEEKYKFLKSVQRKLDRLRDKEGYAHDYAAFVRRVARVLGAKRIVFEAEVGEAPTRQSESWSRNRGYVELSLADGEHRIRRIEREWRAAGEPKPEEAVS